MILNKWNYEKHAYEEHEIPSDWKCITYSPDMEEIVNCPHCGEEIKVGDSYTSMEFHTPYGFGYLVCRKCYDEEFKRRMENEEV